MTQPSELYYLDAFPEECEALANSYQAGELTDEVFWAKLDEIKKQTVRQWIRNKLERVLAGKPEVKNV